MLIQGFRYICNLKWLQENYNSEVVTFTADIGQGQEIKPVRNKVESLGVKIFIEDLKEEFVEKYVFPMFRANALYEGVYLLGTYCSSTYCEKTN